MKHLVTLALLLCVSTLASAQSLVDDFTGLTVGANLAGQSGWTKGGSGPDLTVGNTTPLTYTGYMNGGGEYSVIPLPTSTASRVYKTFMVPVTNYSGTTFYYSFLLRLDSTSTTATGYFLSLGAPGTSTSYGAKLFARTSGAGFNIGLSKTSNTAVFGSTVFSLHTTYLIVVRYSFNSAGTATPEKYDDVAYLWVNPALTGEPSTGTAECTVPAAGTDTDFDGYGTLSGGVGNFVWHNRGTSNPSGAFDGVRVANGTTSAAAWTNLVTDTPSLAVSPSSIDFGGLNIGQFVTDTLTVTNSGYAALNITSVTPSLAVFSIAPSSGSIPAQSRFKFAVKYTPTAAQADSGTFAFVSNAASSPDTVVVKGIGKQPGFSVTPSSINFRNVWKDSTVTDTLFVTNKSITDHLVIDTVITTDTLFSVTPVKADLDTSKVDTFIVAFNPHSKGAKSASVVFFHDSPVEHDTVALSGNCITKEPGFLATPSPLDFHGVLVGKSKVDTITVKNDGYDSLFISNVTSTSGSFTVTPTTARLDSMASTKFVVTFSPATAGLKSGSLVFESNVAETKDTVLVSGNGSTVTTIAEVRIDANSDLIPDHSITKDTLFVTGVITSPNVQTAPQSGYFVQDSTAGVIIFSYDAAPVEVAVGDSVFLIGKVAQYRGLTEFTPLKMDTVNFKVLKHNAVLPKPKVITVSQFVTNPETYEGSLIEIDTLYYSSGTWPADGSNGNLFYKEKTGADSVQIFVDKDTQVDGTVQPLDPVNFKGVVSQYSSASTVYNDGYELIPRDTSDIKHVVIDAVAGRVNGIPKEFYLSQNYPNPFNPATTIEFGLPKESHVQIAVYNVLGQRVVLLVDGVMKAGNHRVAFNASRFASGVYFYVMRAGEKVFKQKMLLMK